MFGLAPILLVWVVTGLPLGKQANWQTQHELGHLLKDGAVNFFCLAIMGSITIDVLNARKCFESNFPYWMLVLGGGVALTVAITYVAFVIGGDGVIHFGEVGWLSLGLCIVSFVFCTVGKMTLFLKEDNL